MAGTRKATRAVSGAETADGGNAMACTCSRALIGVLSVTTSGGVTTITLPSDVSFVNGAHYLIGLFVNVPAGTNGTQINVTNGTVTYTVMNRMANYFRPSRAFQRGFTFRLRYLDDPSHFIVS